MARVLHLLGGSRLFSHSPWWSGAHSAGSWWAAGEAACLSLTLREAHSRAHSYLPQWALGEICLFNEL